MINLFEPAVGEEELAGVRAVFASGWLGKGPRTSTFEAAFAAHLGVPDDRLVSLNSCTEGLFLAMELLDVGPGDEVVLPSVSFVGAANAVAARGATPVFCDVDPATLNPGVDHIAPRLTAATRAVLVLHYGGYPGDMENIAALCRDRGIPLVEDAACAVASRAAGTACGTFGDIGLWSFDPMKILVTGDGGMLYARDPAVAHRAAERAYLGMRQVSGYAQAATRARWWDFQVGPFGRRSITNDIASAIGAVQLERLPSFIRRRQEITHWYNSRLAGVAGLRCPPPPPPGHESSYYFYWVRMDRRIRDEVATRLYRRGVYTSFRYAPLHLVSAYGPQPPLPGAERASEETLCIPLHQGLDDEQLDTVATELCSAVAELSGPAGIGTP
ncbi:DegT/DnrJ/EryC1/StrS family aminotransferase [Streptomyces pinistramenti]|uniref:DegT/DnrJ/EryC1/StrS family aminotransferase n=1 Tax=Streptomyces pinistramenti TaxID=2884812 RepID=UPI001D05EC95|nr:DegT/DnrJ/EryC1/StrS family aminotransferase [Streptomyces pinistramenti]MCB5909689.1 DegT/DnrJ/EryC1/StrS family aminotransferase [Streptomyces pinistramenti]